MHSACRRGISAPALRGDNLTKTPKRPRGVASGMPIAGRDGMNALDHLIPAPRLLEIDGVDLAVPCEQAWELVRHGDFARSRLVHALFALRTLPTRLASRHPEPVSLRLDRSRLVERAAGFQVLVDHAPREVAVAAIGKVWQPNIPFVHVATAREFASFQEAGFVKVAWAIRLSPLGEKGTHLAIEVRVDATDQASWEKFQAYFLLIGPGSHFWMKFVHHFIEGEQLRNLAARAEGRLPRDDWHDVGEGLRGIGIMAAALLTPFLQEARSHWGIDAATAARAYPGDELVAEPRWSWTHGIEIDAPAADVFPWIAQVGAE